MPTAKTLFVGDVHAQFHHLAKLVKHTDAHEVIVVADFVYGLSYQAPKEPFKTEETYLLYSRKP